MRGARRELKVAALAAVVGSAAVGGQGCGQDLDWPCGLVCPEKGILEGNTRISGIAGVDAFFRAVVDLRAASARASGAVRAELDGLAVSVGLEAGAQASAIRAAVEAKIDGAVSGGLRVSYEPARCEVSVEVTAAAAAECDVMAEPGSLAVECQGACDIDASAQAECSAKGTLSCVGQAPGLACSGSCKGTCELSKAAACEGTCRGSCKGGTCSVVDAQGNCAGACDGMCQGSCELSAGGSCAGECQGECTYTPAGASCDAGVQARCEAMAGAQVECKGGCEGTATPPMVAAECEATVEASAKASAECTPPALEVSWQWSATLEGDAAAQAEFRAWLRVFEARMGGLLAATAKAELLADAAMALGSAGEAAVKDTLEALRDNGDLRASIGAACAIGQLGDVGTIVGDVGTSLQASLTAAGEVLVVLGG